jgi:hypothetical protein
VKGRAIKVGIAFACLAVALTAATAAGGVTPVGDGHGKKKHKFVFLKARVFSDGFVTPGQLETISITHLAPRAQIKVLIEPPPTTPECGELYFCDPAPTVPAEGSPPYRSSGKGLAMLTFVMPDRYFVETNPFHPSQGRFSTFAQGQSVHIDVAAASTRKHFRIESFGFGRSIVQLPPSG